MPPYGAVHTKNQLAFASRISVLALPIFLCRQSIVPPVAGPDVLCRIGMRKATCRWQVAFQMLALPIFPCSHPQSIVGEGELNFCVRDGNRWTLTPINTNFVDAKSALLRFRRSLTRPRKLRPLPCVSSQNHKRFAGLRFCRSGCTLKTEHEFLTLKMALSLLSPIVGQALGLLVSVSYTPYGASTPDLSTT